MWKSGKNNIIKYDKTSTKTVSGIELEIMDQSPATASPSQRGVGGIKIKTEIKRNLFKEKDPTRGQRQGMGGERGPPPL